MPYISSLFKCIPSPQHLTSEGSWWLIFLTWCAFTFLNAIAQNLLCVNYMHIFSHFLNYSRVLFYLLYLKKIEDTSAVIEHKGWKYCPTGLILIHLRLLFFFSKTFADNLMRHMQCRTSGTINFTKCKMLY